jgi:CBS domain-containing protein
MHVKEIMTTNVRACGPEDSLEAAAQRMWDNDVGCLPVTDEAGRVLAMLTDRDICMAAWTQGCRLADIPVRTAMSGALRSIGPDEVVAQAGDLMRRHQIRRLPVVDDQGRLLGLLAMNDIAREAERQRTQHKRSVTAEEVARTLAGICRPRVCLVEPPVEATAMLPVRSLVASH